VWAVRFLFDDEKVAAYYHLFLGCMYIAAIAYHVVAYKRHMEDYHKLSTGHISQLGH